MRRLGSLLFVMTIVLAGSGCAYLARSDVGLGGARPNGPARLPDVSGSGRFVAFESSASNLVAGDTNRASDVFVRDHRDGVTTRVSVGASGLQANNGSHQPSISDDGNFIAFQSYASNLVAGDTNGYLDVFVHDRRTRTTRRVSVATGGAQADGASGGADISGDGRSIAFSSFATNLVADDTNGQGDVFVNEHFTTVTYKISTAASVDSFAPDISDDGRVVVYSAGTAITVHDRRSGDSGTIPFHVYDPAVSGDGRTIVFATNVPFSMDSNGTVADIVKRTVMLTDTDMSLGTMELVTQDPGCVTPRGDSTSPVLSDDGRVIAFTSTATELDPSDHNGVADIFVKAALGARCPQRTSLTGTNAELDGASGAPSLSDDGKYVAMHTAATNLDESGPGSKIALRYALAPESPVAGDATIARGTSGIITLSDAYFAPDVQILVAPGEGVTAEVIDSSAGTIDLRVTVSPVASTERRTIVVVNPGNSWDPGANGVGVCHSCLVIR
jgi:Tol biopolymer transport system component